VLETVPATALEIVLLIHSVAILKVVMLGLAVSFVRANQLLKLENLFGWIL